MERVSGAASLAVMVIAVVIWIVWLWAIVDYFDRFQDDPDAGCRPGADCDTCPFPPCEKKKTEDAEQKGE